MRNVMHILGETMFDLVFSLTCLSFIGLWMMILLDVHMKSFHIPMGKSINEKLWIRCLTCHGVHKMSKGIQLTSWTYAMTCVQNNKWITTIVSGGCNSKWVKYFILVWYIPFTYTQLEQHNTHTHTHTRMCNTSCNLYEAWRSTYRTRWSLFSSS